MEAGLTKTCTSAVAVWSAVSVTLSRNLYTPTSMFDRCRYGLVVPSMSTCLSVSGLLVHSQERMPLSSVLRFPLRVTSLLGMYTTDCGPALAVGG